jgi:hypothetical protein
VALVAERGKLCGKKHMVCAMSKTGSRAGPQLGHPRESAESNPRLH